MSAEALAELRRTTRRGLELAASWRREDYAPDTIGGMPRMVLGQAVTGLVLGMEDDARPIVRRARDGLAASVARDLRPVNRPEYFAAVRLEALGLATWLLDGNPGDFFADAVRRHPRAPDILPELVRDCLLAGMPATGVEIYRHVVGTSPAAPQDVTTPLELAVWLCDRLSRLRPPASWVAVAERVLRKYLPVWLDRGHGVEAGLWLALAYAESGAALTLAEALRRGGLLVGALPADPLAAVLLDSLGDPVDVDLFTGFLAAVSSVALPEGSELIVDLLGHAPLTAVAEPSDGTSGLDRAVAAAVATTYNGGICERLAAAARGRLVAADGETPLLLREVRVS